MNLPNESEAKTFSQLLQEKLTIENSFHEIIRGLCGGRFEYMRDIDVGDLIGKEDSSGAPIPPAVARGIVRKLRAYDHGASTSSMIGTIPGTNPRGNEINRPSEAAPCSVLLQRGHEEFSSLVRCSVRGELRQGSVGLERRKILTAVLDNSGSMMGHWSLLVDAVGKVFTDDLLTDSFVTLKAIAYNTEAKEVKLPSKSDELSTLLRTKFSPRGITNFQSAFELAADLIKSEVNKLAGNGIPLDSIDVTTLIFTDGADTSVAPLGNATEAAAEKARKAGDIFQGFLKTLGCSAYTCVAAFGEGHDPKQCHYLSDRYYYINRREVLSDWLTGGLSDLLQSSGFFSLKVQLPNRLSLLEPLPKTIQLDSKRGVDYDVWLLDKTAGGRAADGDDIVVCVEDNGKVSLSGSASLSSVIIADADSLSGRQFLLDAGEMQLRQIALELRGRRPTLEELSMLRERLVGAQALTQPVSDDVTNPKARVVGRALLLSRIEELEARRNRLSYTLGHFEDEEHGDTRKIGAVGIDAVLRDASQRVPLGPEASRYNQRAAATAAMESAEELSAYGKGFFFDPLSGCDAKQATDQGDALFFSVSDASFSNDGSFVSASESQDQPVAHDVFMMLSKKGQNIATLPHVVSGKQTSIPVYASVGHFRRAILILPEVLERLVGNYVPGKSERVLLGLLGQSLASYLRNNANNPDESLALIHKARSVSAVFEMTKSLQGEKDLLQEVLSEAKKFTENKETRKDIVDLYSVAAIGLLAQEWSRDDYSRLGNAVVEESMRRALGCRLKGGSMTARFRMAWSLLGGEDGNDGWLECPLDGSRDYSQNKKFDIISVASEMESLERLSPNRYSPIDPGVVLDVFRSTTRAGTPRMEEWPELRELFCRWGNIVLEERPKGGLWCLLDKMMIDDSVACEGNFSRIEYIVKRRHAVKTLGDVISDPNVTLTDLAKQCIKGLLSDVERKAEFPQDSARLQLAFLTTALVKRRESMARKYPIIGKEFPSLPKEKRMHEVWGASAHPIDTALYAEVRRIVHRENWDKPITIREALTDKEYRNRGGHFEFLTRLDTFVSGLHRRTRDLHSAWTSEGRQTQGPQATRDAVSEMMLRLPWDDRDDCARKKLSMILEAIWDGLNDVPAGEPLPSALWLDDNRSEEVTEERTSDIGDRDGWDVI